MTSATMSGAYGSAPPGPSGRWRQLRFALLALAALGGVLLVALGAAPASYADLNVAIATGRVDEVRVFGALPPGSTGYATVDLWWRDHERARHAVVVQQSDVAALSPTQQPEHEHVVGDIEAQLRARGVIHLTRAEHDTYGPTIAGRQVPAWLGWAVAALWLATLLVLRNGVDPWWGTRWAWFWVLFSPLALLAVPAFLLLSGSAPGVSPLGGPGRRLTGGWAFLITLFLGPAVGQLLTWG